tara:strand:+ start:83 stop:1327 length:1245 start_codon:yes stop_codon:yes gene_type:complete
MKEPIIEKVKLSEIRPNPSNPRELSREKFDELVKSIKDFPKMLSAEPIKIADGVILSGNQRYQALKRLGHKEAYVQRLDHFTEEERLEYIIKANVHSGIWDWDMLANGNEWDEYQLNEWGLDVWQPEEDIKNGLTDPDEVPEVPKEPATKLGDLYLLGEHRLLCGDSTKAEDVEKLMNGEKAEILFTSPPYSDMREYNGDKDLSIGNLVNFIPTFSNYANYQVINLGIQRKDNEVIQYWDDYISKAKETGYKLLSWNIWDKGMATSIGSQTAIFPIFHEWIFVFGNTTKDINRTKENKNGGKMTKGSNRQKDGTTKKKQNKIKEFGKIGTITSTGVSTTGEHPAMFPVELPEEYIKAMTNESDVISEPFLGSGTTLIAAEKTNRKCYGIELDPKYCDVIVKRWEDFTGKKAQKM